MLNLIYASYQRRHAEFISASLMLGLICATPGALYVANFPTASEITKHFMHLNNYPCNSTSEILYHKDDRMLEIRQPDRDVKGY